MTMTTVKQVVSVKPTDLRMNDAYIFYYNNLAKLIITGIVPFVALCVFNTKVKIHMLESIKGFLYIYYPAQQYKNWVALGGLDTFALLTASHTYTRSSRIENILIGL